MVNPVEFARYQVASDGGLQINQINTIHLNFPQSSIGSIGMSVGIPKWHHGDWILLRYGWDQRDKATLLNISNEDQDYLWQRVTIPAGGVFPLRFRLETATGPENEPWPDDTTSFRITDLQVDGVSVAFDDWAFWIEEDTIHPPGDQTGAPPTCIAFPGTGVVVCPVCAPDVSGTAGICPLVRHERRFQYKQYLWHGRWYWCIEQPF
jgi:hypothetical protein